MLCNEFTTIISTALLDMPVKRIHVDFTEIEGYQVLIIIDVHSKYIEAMPLHQTTTATTFQALQTFFAKFGFWKSH